MIRRLAAAGCPISYRDLLSTEYPLRVSELMPVMATNIVPLSCGATGIALRLRILATSNITIRGFELRRRNWASFPVHWTEFCEEHRAFCFHDGVYRAEIPAGETLNFRILQPGLGSGELKRSTSIEGYLLGTIPEHLIPVPGEKLDAILIISDGAGDEYPFEISISLSPPMRSVIHVRQNEPLLVAQARLEQLRSSQRTFIERYAEELESTAGHRLGPSATWNEHCVARCRTLPDDVYRECIRRLETAEPCITVARWLLKIRNRGGLSGCNSERSLCRYMDALRTGVRQVKKECRDKAAAVWRHLVQDAEKEVAEAASQVNYITCIGGGTPLADLPKGTPTSVIPDRTAIPPRPESIA